jgi:hypothetical protein
MELGVADARDNYLTFSQLTSVAMEDSPDIIGIAMAPNNDLFVMESKVSVKSIPSHLVHVCSNKIPVCNPSSHPSFSQEENQKSLLLYHLSTSELIYFFCEDI